MDRLNEVQTSGWVSERLVALAASDDWLPDTTRGLARLRQLHSARKVRTQRWLVSAALVAAGFAAALYFPGPRVLAHRCLDCSVAVWQSIAPTAVSAEKVKSVADRKVAPHFELADASGKQVRVSDFRGKVLLLNFWATWCRGCKTEIPWFIEFKNGYKDKDFDVLGVALDADSWKTVRPYITEKNVNYPIVVGDDNVAALYWGSEGLPVSFLIDKDGRIAVKHAGVVDKKNLQSQIEALLAEPRTVPAR